MIGYMQEGKFTCNCGAELEGHDVIDKHLAEVHGLPVGRTYWSVDDDLAAENKRLKGQLEEANWIIAEVSQWIDGWDPNFTYDDDWPKVQNRIDAYIKAHGKEEKR